MEKMFLGAALLLLALLNLPLTTAHAQNTTAFTYQGRLNDASGPATGLFNLQFSLYDAVTNGSLQGTGTATNAATPVTNGLFTVTVDFGYGAFDGNPRWLEIAVQPADGTNFTTLAPRQAVTPAPMAQYAAKAGSASTANVANQATFTLNSMNANHATSAYSASTVPASGITGTLDPSQLPAGLLTNGASGVNLAGAFAGDGGGLTNIAAIAAINTNIAAIAATLAIPPGMALIPAGTFTMGNSIGDSDITDANPTNVTVSAFYMDVNLVSYSQWNSVYYWATNHGYGFVNGGAGKAANHPVQMVDWYDCVKWCNARSQQAGKMPVYYTDAGLTQICSVETIILHSASPNGGGCKPTL